MLNTQATQRSNSISTFAMVLIIAGSATSATTWLLRTSRFASIENRTDRISPELYSELAVALPLEQILIVVGAIAALSGFVLLLIRRIFTKRSSNS
jgi:hypothetical protein